METILTGQKIHRIRTKELHMGLEPFAEKMWVSKQTVIRIEKGKSRPKRWFIERLEEVRKSPVVTQIRHYARKCKKRIKLIEARMKSGWTQREVGRMLGVDQTMISKWENGAIIPEKWIMALCQIYRMAKVILFPEVGQKENRLLAKAA